MNLVHGVGWVGSRDRGEDVGAVEDLSRGWYMRRIGRKAPAGVGSQFASRSGPGESFCR